MKQILTIDGSYYSDNKRKFKKILKEYGLAWKGRWASNEYKWISDTTTVNAEFERDSNDMFTVQATLNISGDEDFINKVVDWASEGLLESKSGNKSKIEKINAKYTKEIRMEKRGGAPSSFIRAIKSAWKQELENV